MLGGLVPPKQFRLAAATAATQEEGGKLYQDLDGFCRCVEQLRALNHAVTITTLTGAEMQVNRLHWSCWSFAARAWAKPPSFSAFRAPASLCPETALALQGQQHTPHFPSNPPRCMGREQGVDCIDCIGRTDHVDRVDCIDGTTARSPCRSGSSQSPRTGTSTSRRRCSKKRRLRRPPRSTRAGSKTLTPTRASTSTASTCTHACGHHQLPSTSTSIVLRCPSRTSPTCNGFDIILDLFCRVSQLCVIPPPRRAASPTWWPHVWNTHVVLAIRHHDRFPSSDSGPLRRGSFRPGHFRSPTPTHPLVHPQLSISLTPTVVLRSFSKQRELLS